MKIISRRNRIMTTATKTRVRVSAKSWLKAERKEAAKVYKSPNVRCRWTKFDKVYFAQVFRENMIRNYRELVDDDSSKEMRRLCLEYFLSWRLDYRRAVFCDSKYKSILPLP